MPQNFSNDAKLDTATTMGGSISQGRYGMDDIEIVAGSKIEWTLDSVTPKTIRARHLGRPISFEYFSTKDPVNYESIQVLGTLEGVVGADILVSGDLYDGDRIAHAKSHRKKLA